ncbi:MAG: hypothetical protein ABW107_23640, partial [Candidatus Thiodiazotropha sp. 6PLUC5]
MRNAAENEDQNSHKTSASPTGGGQCATGASFTANNQDIDYNSPLPLRERGGGRGGDSQSISARY